MFLRFSQDIGQGCGHPRAQLGDGEGLCFHDGSLTQLLAGASVLHRMPFS